MLRRGPGIRPGPARNPEICEPSHVDNLNANAGRGGHRPQAHDRRRAEGGAAGRAGDLGPGRTACLRMRCSGGLRLPAAGGDPAAHDRRSLGRAGLSAPRACAGRAARGRHLARRRRAADGGRGDGGSGAHEPGAGGRLSEPLHPGRGRAHQPCRDRRGRGRGVLLCPRPLEPAGLRHRRQHRDEFGWGALPEVRGDRRTTCWACRW